jgi:hypothetical protein
VDDELGDRGVERVVRPRKRLCPPAEVGAWNALGARLEHRRRVDAGDILRAEAAGELLGEDAGAAADIEDALAGGDPAEVREHRRELAGVAAHEAVVGVARDVEAHPGRQRIREGDMGRPGT